MPALAFLQALAISCRNTGGPGHFHICREGQDPSTPNQDPDNAAYLGPFQISPAAFALGRQEQLQLQLLFSPDHTGEHTEKFVMKCNNGTQMAYQIFGTGQIIQLLLRLNPKHQKPESWHSDGLPAFWHRADMPSVAVKPYITAKGHMFWSAAFSTASHLQMIMHGSCITYFTTSRKVSMLLLL